MNTTTIFIYKNISLVCHSNLDHIENEDTLSNKSTINKKENGRIYFILLILQLTFDSNTTKSLVHTQT